MESFRMESGAPVENVENADSRDMGIEQLGEAEQSVRTMFETKLAEVLERIGENPYMRDFGERI